MNHLMTAISIVLYVVGALAAGQAIVHSGTYRDFKKSAEGIAALAIILIAWPVFTLCVTFTTAAGVKRLKKFQSEQRAAQAAQGGE